VPDQDTRVCWLDADGRQKSGCCPLRSMIMLLVLKRAVHPWSQSVLIESKECWSSGNRCAVNASGDRLQFGRFKLASWVELSDASGQLTGDWIVCGVTVVA
jgi:hypothetical protein